MGLGTAPQVWGTPRVWVTVPDLRDVPSGLGDTAGFGNTPGFWGHPWVWELPQVWGTPHGFWGHPLGWGTVLALGDIRQVWGTPHRFGNSPTFEGHPCVLGTPRGFGGHPWVLGTPCGFGGHLAGLGNPRAWGTPDHAPARSCRSKVLGRATLRLSQISRDPEELEGEQSCPFWGPQTPPTLNPLFSAPRGDPPQRVPALLRALLPALLWPPARLCQGTERDLGGMGDFGGK